jgi:hypothetical protein
MHDQRAKPAARGAGGASRSSAAKSTVVTSPMAAKMPASASTPRSKKGVSITDELAERLAAEAEQGYDLARGQRVGRKSLAGGAGQSPRLNFRTTPELYERASAQAQREGKSVSQLAREALERYVK